MCFILIGPGVAEFTHFIFPILSQMCSHGGRVRSRRRRASATHGDLPNFWVHVTGRYYFPGMYTAILPMIPGIYGIRKLLAGSRLAGWECGKHQTHRDQRLVDCALWPPEANAGVAEFHELRIGNV